ncbi:MAG: cache type 2 domain-containing protein [Pseudomonadota bacterium]
MKMFMISAATVYLACAAGGACAADPAERDAIAMAERGAALIKAKGQQEMMMRIHAHHPDFYQGTLTLDMRDLYTGIVLADSANPAQAGKPLSQGPDPNSTFPRQVIELAQRDGHGWIARSYRDPATGKYGMKSTYVLKVGDVVLQADLRRQ